MFCVRERCIQCVSTNTPEKIFQKISSPFQTAAVGVKGCFVYGSPTATCTIVVGTPTRQPALRYQQRRSCLKLMAIVKTRTSTKYFSKKFHFPLVDRFQKSVIANSKRLVI